MEDGNTDANNRPEDRAEQTGPEQAEKRARPVRPWRYVLVVDLLILLALAVCFNIVVYTNYNNIGQLFRVFTYIQNNYVEKVPVSDLVDGAIGGMVKTLDPYSSYQNAEQSEEFRQEISGRIGGVGILISSADPSKLVVVKVFGDSPAERAGLLTGDIIIRADGQSLLDMDQDKAVSLIRGEPGTEVTIDVSRGDEGRTFSATLRREYIVVPSVEGSELPGQPDIALIAVSSFTEQTGNEFEQMLRELDVEHKSGVILDLRYNSGGEVRAALKTAGFLVPGEEIFYVVDRNGKETAETSDSPYIQKPLVVLVNEYSASAAEIVAGAVKDYGSGKLVGVKTYGKGVMQTVYDVQSSSLVLTTNKYLTPGRHDIHGLGIEPDVAAALAAGETATIMPEAEPFDSQLREAERVLREMTAE
ncbi:MAG: S41 family peptidase [Gracilibacteraceae bacterium]|nr:S41 family peptidase [Gracilibacteraceae bacterium]